MGKGKGAKRGKFESSPEKIQFKWENIPLKRGRRRVKLGRERGKGV
jgi:hypothetical protein